MKPKACIIVSHTLYDSLSPYIYSFEGINSRNHATESWPWVEKYRPSQLNDLIAHEEIISTLNRLIDAQKFPHLLFYGPPGTGKTSMIIAAAKRLYGKNYSSMVLELNASDDRGIDVVRNQIKEFAGTKKLFRLIYKHHSLLLFFFYKKRLI
jgi:replication factor C subunit 3/5